MSKKTTDRIVDRTYIKSNKTDTIDFAFDVDTDKLVSIKKAFNGTSHEYYITDEDGKHLPVMAVQGRKKGWHFKPVGTHHKSGKKNGESSTKHNIIVQLIRNIGAIKVAPLRLCDDRCLTSDFEGLNRSLFENIQLLPECTIKMEEVHKEEVLQHSDRNFRPDIWFRNNGEEYAIEVVDTHALYPDNDEDGALEKMQYYNDRKVNVIVVDISHRELDDIIENGLTGTWWRCNYAHVVFDKLYYMCQHSFIKSEGTKINNLNTYGAYIDSCWKSKQCGIDSNMAVEQCKKCQEQGFMCNGKRVHVYAFRDRDREVGDKTQRFFEYRNGNCIHCFKEGEFRLFRTTEYLSLPVYLNSFRISFGESPHVFDSIWNEETSR